MGPPRPVRDTSSVNVLLLNWTQERAELLDTLERRLAGASDGGGHLHVYTREVPLPASSGGRRTFRRQPELELVPGSDDALDLGLEPQRRPEAVIVLPDLDRDEPDAYSGIFVRRLGRRFPRARIIVEIVDPEARAELEAAGAELLLERGALTAAIIAHTCVDDVVARVLRAFVGGRARIVTLPVPASVRKLTFADSVARLSQTEDGRPITLLGTLEGGRPHLDPEPKAALEHVDALVALVGTVHLGESE